MKAILAVAIGGSVGAVGRHLVGVWAAAHYGANFPYGTLIVNIVGCFIIGIFMTIFNERAVARELITEHGRLLVVTGIIGGFTTFSAYSYETVKLFQQGETVYAVCNVFANLIIGFLGTCAGVMMARHF